MTFDGRNGRRGLGMLLRDLAEGSAALVRGEATLAKIEVAEIATGIGKGTAFVATGAVLALLGALSVLAGIVLLIGDQWLPADLYWLGALVVAVDRRRRSLRRARGAACRCCHRHSSLRPRRSRRSRRTRNG